MTTPILPTYAFSVSVRAGDNWLQAFTYSIQCATTPEAVMSFNRWFYKHGRCQHTEYRMDGYLGRDLVFQDSWLPLLDAA